MSKRVLFILAVVNSLLLAKLVEQPAVGGYQRITRNISIQNLGMSVYGDIAGGISPKYRSSDEWVTLTIDPMWHRIIYMHSYLDGDERETDSIFSYEGEGAGGVYRPMGICYDTRNDGHSTRHYFLVAMPDSNKIKRYYYDETDGEIYYDDFLTCSSYRPHSIAFTEGDNCDWLVSADPSSNKVWFYRVFGGLFASGTQYTGSGVGGMKWPKSVAVAEYGSSQARFYIADIYNHRIITVIMNSDGQFEPSSEKCYDFPDDIYPVAIATANYPSNHGLYVVDANGDVHALSADLNWLVAKYETNYPIYKCRHLSFSEGEAGAAEMWHDNSGMQYFWIDCEVKNLRVSPYRIPQGAYPRALFDVTGPTESITATIKNSQGYTVLTQEFYRKGIDRYNNSLRDVAGLPPGTYTVIVEAEDPYDGNESYTIHSADTAEFVIEAGYSRIGFESNEPWPYSNSFLFNNCCSSVTGVRMYKEDNDKLRPHSGRYTFKFSGYDNSSDGEYDCVDCKLFDNCGIAITKPTYLSCWIKATEAPAGADSLYVSVDGIIIDANYSWQQLKLWTKYGKCIDQYGQWIHGGYHPVPVDSQWHYYVFSLTPAAGDTLQILQFSYWGVPVENTGQFTVYLDDISISPNAHPYNMWYAETFGNGTGSSHENGDPNFELGLSLIDEDGKPCRGGAKIIVDGHGDSGEGEHWLSPAPSLRKELHPYIPVTEDMELAWAQYDKAHAISLSLLIDDHWLHYIWNSPQRWPDVGYVDMGDEGHPKNYKTWETFVRPVYEDYMTEYGVAPQELKAFKIFHYCKSEWDADSGGSISWVALFDEGPGGGGGGDAISLLDWLEVRIPNGGERWKIGSRRAVQWWWYENHYPEVVGYLVQYCTDYGSGNTWKNMFYVDNYPCEAIEHCGWGRGWQIPSDETPSKTCRVRVIAMKYENGVLKPLGYDISDEDFEIYKLFILPREYWDVAHFIWHPPWEEENEICSVPHPGGEVFEIAWLTDGVDPVVSVSLQHSTDGGATFQTIATGLDPGEEVVFDSCVVDTGVIYYTAFHGFYPWTVPETPTSGGKLRYVAYDTTGDSATYVFTQTFNIPFGGAAMYSTAQTADKITTDEYEAHLVYADEVGNILASSNPNGYEWEAVDTLGQGKLPTLVLDGDGNPCVVWVTGSENQESIAFSKYNQGTWSPPLPIAGPNPQGATRFSESTLWSCGGDTLGLATFKATGGFMGDVAVFNSVALLSIRFSASTPLFQIVDTVWQCQGTSLTPTVPAPAHLIDSHNDPHYAFNRVDSTFYLHTMDTTVVTPPELISTSSSAWPSLSATAGNVYLTYGTVVSGDTCLIQRWKHPQDTFWRGQDTLYKGSFVYAQTMGGAATLFQTLTGKVSRVSFDPIEHTADTAWIADSSYFAHGALCYRTLGDGLPLIWTQQSSSAYYVATDWHDPEETIFPSYYLEAGGVTTPYTEYRDSTIAYTDFTVDWGADSLVYHLDNLDFLCNHTLLLEFYFENDTLFSRNYIVTIGEQTDTVNVITYTSKRATLGLWAGDTAISVKITSDTGSVELSRLLLYQGEETGGGQCMAMGAKGPKKQAIPYVLYQNLPNPFVGTTLIRYALPYNRHVSLKVYDVAGRRVRTLVDENKKPGIYELNWDGKDNTSAVLPAGVYFIRFETEDFEQTKKAVLLK